MKKFLKSVVLACTIAGLSSAAHAQAPQCVALDSKGAVSINMTNGQIFKFVPKDNALMRDINAQAMPQLLGKVSSIKLQPRCEAQLYGNGGAAWGHMVVKKSGPTGVPAKHVYGIACRCK